MPIEYSWNSDRRFLLGVPILALGLLYHVIVRSNHRDPGIISSSISRFAVHSLHDPSVGNEIVSLRQACKARHFFGQGNGAAAG